MLLVKTPPRGVDSYGSGAYLAKRGSRLHNGVDFSAVAGSDVASLTCGKVTKIGFPYRYDPDNPAKAKYRYVEVTTDGNKLRYFYLTPAVKLGDKVKTGDIIGSVQDLTEVYKGIKNHVHFEVKNEGNNFLDPNDFLETLHG